MKKLLMAIIGAAAFASAAMAGEVNLKTLAVKDGSGNLVVLWDEHDSGWWAGNQYTPFDGAIDAAIDPKRVSSPTWVGYELTTPQVVTRIRFYPRRTGDGPERIRACQVEGANQADFSDAVVLLECKDVVPADWRTSTTGWFDVPARAFTTPQTFKYIRFIQSVAGPGESTFYCGNITEVEFYGMDATSYASYVPTVSQETNLRLYALHDSTGALDIVSDKTPPWGAGYEYSKVFDGSIRTFYDPKDRDNAFNSYVGYALVSPMAITRIRYCGRGDGSANASHTERLLYCKIEGANQSDFSDAVTLHLCKNAVPLDWHLHADWLDVVPDAAAGTNAFKYLRFIDYDGHHQCGDVSELEFYGMSADALAANVIANPQAATGLVATRGAYPEVATELRWSVQPGVSDSTLLRAPGAKRAMDGNRSADRRQCLHGHDGASRRPELLPHRDGLYLRRPERFRHERDADRVPPLAASGARSERHDAFPFWREAHLYVRNWRKPVLDAINRNHVDGRLQQPYDCV